MNTMSLIELTRAQRAKKAQILDFEMKMMSVHENIPSVLLMQKITERA